MQFMKEVINMRLIDLDELQEYCSQHEICQSAIDGQLMVVIGQSKRGDDIYEPLFDHIPTIRQVLETEIEVTE